MDVAYTAVLLLGAVVALYVLRRGRNRRAEAALRSLFDPGSEFIGKDLAYIVARAGPACSFGSLDHGREAANWVAGRLVAEAWFQSGVCTEVEIRVRGK